MLLGINPLVTPELMLCLMEMGHGDELVLADANFPSYSTAATSVSGRVVSMTGLNMPQVVELITELMPLDAFTDFCALQMQVDNAPRQINPVHEATNAVIRAAMPSDAALESIERQDFYARAAKAFAVVQTSEERPFGCYILRKGVVF
mgnify:CR=1 FL=1